MTNYPASPYTDILVFPFLRTPKQDSGEDEPLGSCASAIPAAAVQYGSDCLNGLNRV